MIHQVDEFIGYFESVRRRTLNYLRVVPADRVDWSLGLASTRVATLSAT